MNNHTISVGVTTSLNIVVPMSAMNIDAETNVNDHTYEDRVEITQSIEIDSDVADSDNIGISVPTTDGVP